MCGIVGYIGNKDALSVVISGLEKLEYRGYDSAGVAVSERGEIVVTRAQGRLAELKKLLVGRDESARAPIGIGHTRWATHGKPSETNAHPHTAGRVSLIHNGIVENYAALRDRLAKNGAVFRSETDTEVAAHLLDFYLASGAEPFEALKLTCAEIKGSYAFVALDSKNPDRLLVAKNATPIVVGIGEDEVIVASDIPAVLPLTRKVVILEDGDLAEVRIGALRIENHGKAVKREAQTITWDPITAQKGGYKHYMLKEINDQVQVLADVFRGRLEFDSRTLNFPELSLSAEDAKRINRIVLVACGSAWHAGLVTKFYIEAFAGIPCEVDYASEYRYRTPVYDKNTMVIAISQSGETADTLAAIELVRKEAMTMAICNVVGSSLTRRVQHVIFTQAGPEISVASTKAFVTQLAVGYLLGLHLGQLRGRLSPEQLSELIEPLMHLPGAVDAVLRQCDQIEALAHKFYTSRDFLFIGRGLCYPIALEGALKLKEISYIHAEGYPAGEMKHGPIALIDQDMPVVVVMQRDDVIFEKALSNLREVESRNARIIAVTDHEAHPELKLFCEAVLEIPFLSPQLSPILLTIPLQLLSYHIATLNGTDVDLPRNLAKSVTVE